MKIGRMSRTRRLDGDACFSREIGAPTHAAGSVSAAQRRWSQRLVSGELDSASTS